MLIAFLWFKRSLSVIVSYLLEDSPEFEGHFLLLPSFMEIPIFNANNVDPDQTPRSAASDLGLNCLPMLFFFGN